MTRPIEFATQRLQLRQWRDADLAAFAALNADPQVMAHFPHTLSRQASNALAGRIRAEIAHRGWGFWAVEIKGCAPFIGFVGLHVPATALPFAPCVEIGWRLVADCWGQGYATEAARAALAIAFERLGLDEIVSFTARRNQRSQRVMQRIGMDYADTFQHPGLPVGHVLRDHVLYRLRRRRQEVPV